MTSNIKEMRSQHAYYPTLIFLNFTTPTLPDLKMFEQLFNVTNLLLSPKCNTWTTDKWGKVIFYPLIFVHARSLAYNFENVLEKNFQRFSKTNEINYLEVDKLNFPNWIWRYNFHTLCYPKHWSKLSQF